MQTFLPLVNAHDSARRLDRMRLGKQRVETIQILRHLTGEQPFKGGYAYHPVIAMWRGYERALARYGITMCLEWLNRGYQDRLLQEFYAQLDVLGSRHTSHNPPWWGDERFHASHRSNLLRKLPGHYRVFWPDEPDNLFYEWPVIGENGEYTLVHSKSEEQRRANLPG